MIKLEMLIPIMEEAFSNNKTFIFPVHGTSMIPLFRDGDNVEVVKPLDVKRFDIVLFQRTNGAYVLHRVVKIVGDDLFFTGDHQITIEGPVTKDMLKAKVISYSKRGKTKVHHLNGVRYKFYCLMLKCRLIRRVFCHFK